MFGSSSPVDDTALRETLVKIILETSKEDLVEALGEEEYAAEAARGRALLQAAMDSFEESGER